MQRMLRSLTYVQGLAVGNREQAWRWQSPVGGRLWGPRLLLLAQRQEGVSGQVRVAVM